MSDEGHVAFEVLDAFEGLFRLAQRSPTLDGAVPVRVAQACVPLLEGNAFGFQLELTRPLVIERRIGRSPRVIAALPARSPTIDELHRAALPKLVARGVVSARSAWHRAFAERPFCSDKSIIWLWTGLLIRAERGTSLRISATANRRNTLVDLEEVYVEDDDDFVPLLLGITPRFPKGASSIRLEGELATLAPMMSEVEIEQRTLADAKELGEAHVDFYDAAYFATKRGEVTKKYRRMIKRPTRTTGPPVVVPVGPCDFSIERVGKKLAVDRLPSKRASVTSIVFRNPIDFRVTWDGHTVALSYDANELKRLAGEVERTFTDAYGEGFVEKHRGAIWYLTKYFTPHPPGEPHFFVKPWAFVRTQSSWSCLLEGVNGDGYDVMRGVIASDSFHAAPAVFLLRRLGEPIDVPRGTPLLRVFPIPRTLLSSRFRIADGLDR